MARGREISGLALQYGQGERPAPKRHHDGAEKALKGPEREISPIAMEKGGAETSHPSTPAQSRAKSPAPPPRQANSPAPKPRKPTPMADHFDKMVDVRRTPEDRAAENMPFISDDRNHSMCITLCGPELAKLERDADVEPGTLLHFCCMAEVKEVHRGTTESLVVEVIKMAVENEDEEDADDMMSDEDRMKNRYGDEEDHY